MSKNAAWASKILICCIVDHLTAKMLCQDSEEASTLTSGALKKRMSPDCKYGLPPRVCAAASKALTSSCSSWALAMPPP
eukprot:2994390-Karenia_brevis.AAC.1